MQNKLANLFGNVTGLDEKSVNFLTNALAKGNLPGFDYLEFKQSVAKLQEMGIDEHTAYKSAFATASTVGLTKEKLVTTARHYRQLLVTEEQKFGQALAGQTKRRVEGKQQEVELLKKQIAEWETQIQHLQERIAKSQKTIDSADEVIAAERRKIEATRENFEASFRAIVNEMEKDVQNINTLL